MSKAIQLNFFVIKSLIVLSFLFISMTLEAQPGSFEKRYGTNQREYAVKMIQCDNGDLFALAWRGGTPYAEREVLVFRLNYSGDTIWKKSIKDSSTIGLNPVCCIQTLDQGFCILTDPWYGNSNPVRSSSALIKLDGQGQLEWVTEITDQSRSRYDGKNITESPSGDIYISGDATYDCSSPCGTYPYVVKFNSIGQYKWYRKSNLSFYNVTSKLDAISDTTLMLAINGMNNFSIVEFDSSGNTMHTTLYRNTFGGQLELNDWIVDSSGYIKTLLLTNGYGANVSLCTLNSQGNVMTTILANKTGFTLQGVQLLRADTGYVALLKSSGSSNIIITDWSDGISKPNALLAGTSNPFFPYSFIRKPDGCLFVYGSINYPSTSFADPHLIKTAITTNGILPLSGCSTDTTLLTISSITIIDTVSSFAFVSDSLFPYPSYVTDSSLVFNQYNDCSLTGINFQNEQTVEISVFPNPSNGEFGMEGDFPSKSQLYIYNIIGQEVTEPIELPERNNVTSIKTNLAQGIYLYRIVSKGNVLNEGKIVILR